MLRRLKLFAPVLVCLACLVVLSGTAVADPGDPMTDPFDPDGSAEPVGDFSDVVLNVIHYAAGAIWLVIH